MWIRSLLFAVAGLGALAALWASVLDWSSEPLAPLAAGERQSIESAAGAVDAAFERAWNLAGLPPAPPAPRLLVARRMALALCGTVPSLEELRPLERAGDDGVERYLAHLLADRRSADYLAERLARAYVGVEDGPFLLYRRRRFVSWLADQLADNRPYDALVRHLIADTGLWTDTPATNFVTVTINPGNANRPDPNQLAARVARAFLGVRLDCAECHDHPFDRWKQQDFQHLAAFFAGTRQGLRGIRDTDALLEVEDRRTGEPLTIEPAVPFDAQLMPYSGQPRARLAAWVTDQANRAFARVTVNRSWAIMFGRPLVEPIDNLPIDGEVPAALDLLADDFVAHGHDLRRLLRVIGSTRVFRLDSRLADDAAGGADLSRHTTAWAVFPLTRLRPEQVVGSLLQASSLSTIDYQSHILVRFARAVGQNEFIERYGDAGADEFNAQGGTIPQRLLLMNGQLVGEKTKDDLLGNAATQIAVLAADDRAAIETSMLAVLSRRPSDEERRHFEQRLAGTHGNERKGRLGDLYWSLLNTTEFSWNH